LELASIFMVVSLTRNGYLCTLDLGIDAGPTFINFCFFPGPTALLKRGKVLFWCNM
jgi:hypothetical protein